MKLAPRTARWQLGIMAMLLPFLGSAVFASYLAVDHLRAVRSFGRHRSDKPGSALVGGEGPGWTVRDAIIDHDAAVVRTPAGKDAALYIAYVESVNPSSRRYTRRCTLAHLGPVRATAYGISTAYPLTIDFTGADAVPVDGPLQVVFTSSSARVRLRPRGRGPDRSKVVPAEARARCAAAIAGDDPASLRYTEETLGPNEKLSATACGDGERLVPCHDGVDALSSSEIETEGLGFIGWIAGIWMLVLGGGLGAAVAAARVDLRRSPYP